MRLSPRLPDPPLVPSPDEGRTLLRRELLDADYHRTDLFTRLIDWLRRLLVDAVSAASGAPALSVFFALVLALVLAIALLLLLGRARTARVQRTESAAVLEDTTVSWQEWRARAEAAYRAGDFHAAVIDAFRALTVRHAELGDVTATPGSTAREVAAALAAAYPERDSELRHAAATFDLVMYGERPATAEQAQGMLALDEHWRVTA